MDGMNCFDLTSAVASIRRSLLIPVYVFDPCWTPSPLALLIHSLVFCSGGWSRRGRHSSVSWTSCRYDLHFLHLSSEYHNNLWNTNHHFIIFDETCIKKSCLFSIFDLDHLVVAQCMDFCLHKVKGHLWLSLWEHFHEAASCWLKADSVKLLFSVTLIQEDTVHTVKVMDRVRMKRRWLVECVWPPTITTTPSSLWPQCSVLTWTVGHRKCLWAALPVFERSKQAGWNLWGGGGCHGVGDETSVTGVIWWKMVCYGWGSLTWGMNTIWTTRRMTWNGYENPTICFQNYFVPGYWGTDTRWSRR